MKRDFYFYSSKAFDSSEIRKDPLFEHISEYNRLDFEKTHSNEYGRINTKENYFHLLYGPISQGNCPWCGSGTILKKQEIENKSQPLFCIVYYLECATCYSRGPTLTFNPLVTSDLNMIDEVIEITKQKYTRRIPWDHDYL